MLQKLDIQKITIPTTYIKCDQKRVAMDPLYFPHYCPQCKVVYCFPTGNINMWWGVCSTVFTCVCRLLCSIETCNIADDTPCCFDCRGCRDTCQRSRLARPSNVVIHIIRHHAKKQRMVDIAHWDIKQMLQRNIYYARIANALVKGAAPVLYIQLYLHINASIH